MDLVVLEVRSCPVDPVDLVVRYLPLLLVVLVAPVVRSHLVVLVDLVVQYLPLPLVVLVVLGVR